MPGRTGPTLSGFLGHFSSPLLALVHGRIGSRERREFRLERLAVGLDTFQVGKKAAAFGLQQQVSGCPLPATDDEAQRSKDSIMTYRVFPALLCCCEGRPTLLDSPVQRIELVLGFIKGAPFLPASELSG